MQIIVLGMHRSGTSATARLINLMGASVGHPDLIGRPAQDNAKGFWERSDVRDLNDRLLARNSASWDDPTVAGLSVDPAPEDATELANIIFALDADRPWVVKDPRLCLTFPIWRPLLEAPVCVFPLRHPEEVAGSLRERNGFPATLSLALWERYTLSAIASARGLPVIWVDYSRLVAQPEAFTTTMHADLQAAGCTGLRLPSSRELAAFVNPELQHHVATAQHADHAAVRLYRALIEGDVAARSGHWTLSNESCEQLAWRSRERAEREEIAQQLHAESLLSSQAAATVAADAAAEAEATQAREREAMRVLQLRIDESEQAQLQVAEQLRDAERACAELRVVVAELRLASIDASRQSETLLSAEVQSRQAVERQLADETRQGEQSRRQAQHWKAAHDALLPRLDALASEVVAARRSIGEATAQQQQRDHQESRRQASAVALLASVQEQQGVDLQQLARWLSDSLELMRASFSSARWRVGDRLVRAVEMLLLRKRTRLAQHHILHINRQFDAWRLGRVDQRELLQRLQRELGRDSLSPGAERSAAGALTTGTLAAVDAKAGEQVRDVICFPVIDWHFRVQRPQHIARVLGQRGHRVFYLSTQPLLGCASNGFEVLESPVPNVWLVRLRVVRAVFPNLYQEQLSGADLADYVEALDAMRAALGIGTPIAIVDLPFWRPLVEALPGSLLIYDCMDHHAGFATNSAAMLSEEARLLRSADAVIVTSRWLESELGKVRPVELIRNGADVERFARIPERPLHLSERAVVGYIGAISDWFDVNLLERAARAMPDVDFVLVGDVTHPDVSPLSALDNVRFLGEVPYDLAADYVHAFDVCTIPFVIDELTLATNPVKAYEYLAAGKPVVATAMPELLAMDDLVRVADGAPQFIAHLRASLLESKQCEAVERRRGWAAGHDWEQRAAAVDSLIRRQLPKASVIVLAWNNLEFTRSCLASLERFTDYPDWELVLVDNASTDGTPEFFRDYAASRAHVRLVLNDANLGFAAGNNAGIRVASGEVVVLLNNDTFVTPGWLSGLVGHLLRNPELGIVGPVTNNIGNEARIDVNYADMEQMLVESRRWTRAHPRQLTSVDVVAFFCCALPRSIIDDVGLLDEAFGQGFFEDDDYCNRIRAAGRSVAIADDVFVHHHLSASFSTLKEERRRELFERNKAIYEGKWGRWKPHTYRAGVR
jgi:GT2 family glycosyltransferase/glycosyltransferase involved in cell wall biosynthesis